MSEFEVIGDDIYLEYHIVGKITIPTGSLRWYVKNLLENLEDEVRIKELEHEITLLEDELKDHVSYDDFYRLEIECKDLERDYDSLEKKYAELEEKLEELENRKDSEEA